MLLLERAAADIVIPDPEPDRWQEQVREVAYSMRDALLPHRDLAGAALANIPTGEHAMRFADRLLAVLLAGGVDRRHAAMVIDLLPQLVVNDVYEGSLFAQRLERQPDYFARLHEYWGSMPADRFPHVAALSEEIGGGEDEGEVRFAFALSSSSPASLRSRRRRGGPEAAPRHDCLSLSATPEAPARPRPAPRPRRARPRRPPRRACARA